MNLNNFGGEVTTVPLIDEEKRAEQAEGTRVRCCTDFDPLAIVDDDLILNPGGDLQMEKEQISTNFDTMDNVQFDVKVDSSAVDYSPDNSSPEITQSASTSKSSNALGITDGRLVETTSSYKPGGWDCEPCGDNDLELQIFGQRMSILENRIQVLEHTSSSTRPAAQSPRGAQYNEFDEFNEVVLCVFCGRLRAGGPVMTFEPGVDHHDVDCCAVCEITRT